jgi:TRAP-type mannitol/chloroaromatic compound transport system permease small subunit
MKSIDSAVRFAGFLAVSALVVLVLLVAYDALSRYLFSSGSIALQELEWHLFDIVIMLAIAYTLKVNSHVRVDIFYENYSKKSRAWINLMAQILFIIPFSFLILYVGSEFVMLSFSQMEGSSDPGGLPYRFIVKSLMPLAFLLLILQSLQEILKAFKVLKAAQ